MRKASSNHPLYQLLLLLKDVEFALSHGQIPTGWIPEGHAHHCHRIRRHVFTCKTIVSMWVNDDLLKSVVAVFFRYRTSLCCPIGDRIVSKDDFRRFWVIFCAGESWNGCHQHHQSHANNGCKLSP